MKIKFISFFQISFLAFILTVVIFVFDPYLHQYISWNYQSSYLSPHHNFDGAQQIYFALEASKRDSGEDIINWRYYIFLTKGLSYHLILYLPLFWNFVLVIFNCKCISLIWRKFSYTLPSKFFRNTWLFLALAVSIPFFYFSTIFTPSKDLIVFSATSYICQLIYNEKQLSFKFFSRPYSLIFNILGCSILLLSFIVRNQFLTLIPVIAFAIVFRLKFKYILIFTSMYYALLFFFLRFFFGDALNFESYASWQEQIGSSYLIMSVINSYQQSYPILFPFIAFIKFFLSFPASVIQLFKFISSQESINQNPYILLTDFTYMIIFMSYFLTLLPRISRYISSGFDAVSSRLIFCLVLYIFIIGFSPFSQLRYYWCFIPIFFTLILAMKSELRPYCINPKSIS